MTFFSQTETQLLIPGPTGQLELLTQSPEKLSALPAVAIICHPHPLHGGTMRNKVVSTLARTFHDLELQTVRFNFRGVEKSEGSYAEGIGEIDDVFAVMQWVKAQLPQHTIWLAGFSFGAAMSAQAAAKSPDVKQLVSIAPPVPRFNLPTLPSITCPWIVVQGTQDEIVEPAAVFQWIETRNPKPVLITMPAAGHFFHGQLLTLRDELEKTLRMMHTTLS